MTLDMVWYPSNSRRTAKSLMYMAPDSPYIYIMRQLSYYLGWHCGLLGAPGGASTGV